ncbi:hypothetical protein MKX01_037218 [Papaver californicum]|nr:hypothetical protein MKX01_037218 [Papaver californicum]
MKDGKSGDGVREDPINAPLLEEDLSQATTLQLNHHNEIRDDLLNRVWVESKKLWYIAGPNIIIRIACYSIFITQAFVGHLGDLELAAVSVSISVNIGFTFGLLLGMATASETLCGQAYGAKRYHMLGIYLQRSWIVLTLCAILLLPIYIFTTPILKLLGQPDDLSELKGLVTIWLIPLPFAFALQLPLQRFLQCQRKTRIIAWVCSGALLFHIFITWLAVYKLGFGVIGATAATNVSWWITALGTFSYIACGGCHETWTGLSMEAFSGLREFFKLSMASGVMLCLENWYYMILVLMTGNLNNAAVSVSALTVCMSINGWELMIPLAFFTATGDVVLHAVDNLAVLLACTILLNNIQLVLSGVAVGSGWQALVAYINIGCYYIIGIPLEVALVWVFHLGVRGIWSGMIGGTAIQTLTLIIITIRCDWDMQAQKASS